MKTNLPTHSKIGASSCERWWNCPGSVALIETLPPQKTSSYAAEGTAAHALAEQCLRLGKNANEYIGGVSIEIEGQRLPITEEMAEAVQVYLDVIRADMARYGVHPSDFAIEHRFHLAHIDANAYGTNDANLKVAFTKIIVYDYKHGSGVAVDAEDNKQGLYYAVGAAYGEEFDEIEIVIVQPRAIHRDGPVRRWTVSAADLEIFSQELKLKIQETRGLMAPKNCGSWCKKTFCPAMAVCPEVHKQVMAESQLVFQDATAVLPKVEHITPLQLRRFLDAIPMIDAWTKALWAHAENMANQGQEVLGYKLVRGNKGHRKWSDPDVGQKLMREIGLDADDISEIIIKSPAVIEKLRKGKEGKVLKELVDKLTTRSDGKTMLVPADDPREAVNPNVIDVFAEETLT